MSPPPKPTITLRAALSKDIPAIAHLGSKTFSDTFGWSMPAPDLAAYLETAYSLPSITADFSNPDISVIVACSPSSSPSPNLPSSSSSNTESDSEREEVIAFAYLTRHTTDPCLSTYTSLIELQRLYVSPSFHGNGVGRLLMERVETMARDEGWGTMWLGVWEENVRAQGVYQKMGYRKVGMHDFVMGSCVQTDWILVKRL